MRGDPLDLDADQSQPTSHRTSHFTTSQNRTSHFTLAPGLQSKRPIVKTSQLQVKTSHHQNVPPVTTSQGAQVKSSHPLKRPIVKTSPGVRAEIGQESIDQSGWPECVFRCLFVVCKPSSMELRTIFLLLFHYWLLVLVNDWYVYANGLQSKRPTCQNVP